MGTAQATYSAYTPLLSALPSSVQPWLGASGGKEEPEGQARVHLPQSLT